MVKTDFKNIYEAFMHCDTNKLKKEFAAMYSDNEEQAAAMEEVGRKVIHLLEEIYGRKASPEIWALNNFKEFEVWYNTNKKELEANALENMLSHKTAAKKAA